MIFHLTVIVVLLFHQMNIAKEREESFVIDFSKQEEIEKMEKEMKELEEELERRQNMRDEVLKNLEKKLADAPAKGSNIKNIAVNAGGPLKDDRGTDVEQLYKDAADLAKNMKNYKSDIIDDARDETVELPGKDNGKKNGASYTGPSILEYKLGDRSATYLPVPAYTCYEGGTVKVIILVNRQGTVIKEWIDEAGTNTRNKSIRNAALTTAHRSRFARSNNDPEKHEGYIIYQFIAQ